MFKKHIVFKKIAFLQNFILKERKRYYYKGEYIINFTRNQKVSTIYAKASFS